MDARHRSALLGSVASFLFGVGLQVSGIQAPTLAYVLWAIALILLVGALAPSARRLRSLRAPDFEVTSLGNTAAEPWLRRLHLRVEPAEHHPSAPGSWVRVSIDNGPPRALLFDTDEGPREVLTLLRGLPRNVGLVVRSAHATPQFFWGVALDPGVCHVTDDQFLTHKHPADPLAPGHHRIDLTVHYDVTRRLT